MQNTINEVGLKMLIYGSISHLVPDFTDELEQSAEDMPGSAEPKGAGPGKTPEEEMRQYIKKKF
ncbi:hypothetical protein Cyrtocomes_01174 [Candidatus Cyrtobacter comes]|uniref:Uncharacterized protein n=1 Tax=Candidatus Cyrtobacter comes TaxID=675776 RepID=A0ABU5L9I6_9RICK|nr:hypothetical protein [Candidatus Cyrtobacter comes]MDZ5762779.1 hypothetical protein [Candidatus Cyrtobacter comes]